MSTRIAPTHSRGGGPYTPPPGTAINGFAAGAQYRDELAGTRGEATGFAVWACVRVDGAVPVLDVLFADGNLGNFGWFIGCSVAGGYYFDMGSAFGGGTSFNTPLVVPSAVGKVDRIVGVYDPGAGFIRVYVNGAGTAAGFVGPAQFDTGVNDTTIGADSSASWPASRFSIIAAGYTPVVPSAADVLAWDTAMKVTAGNAALAGTTFHWRAADAGNPPGAAWPDYIGAATLSRVGAPTAAVFVSDWA